IGTVVLQLLGLQGPHLPQAIINAAQLMIGTYVGLMLKTNQIANKTKTIGLAVGSGMMLLFGSIILSMLLTKLQPISNAKVLLRHAQDQNEHMGIISHEIVADLSIVSVYQLFRTFFIYFAVPPLLKLNFKKRDKRVEKQDN